MQLIAEEQTDEGEYLPDEVDPGLRTQADGNRAGVGADVTPQGPPLDVVGQRVVSRAEREPAGPLISATSCASRARLTVLWIGGPCEMARACDPRWS